MSRRGTSGLTMRAARAPRLARCPAELTTVGGLSRRTVVVGGLVVVGVGVVGAAPLVAPRIEEYLRPVCSKKPTRVHAVLIDCTDEPLPGSQDNSISRVAERFIDQSRIGDRALVARLALEAENPTQLLKEICDPGRSVERSALTSTYDPDDTEWKAAYLEPWRVAVEAAKKPSPQDKTPLVEGIRQLTATIGFHGRDEAVAKRLLIVSDVLMNSGPASAYKENLSDPAAKMARAYIKEFTPWLVNCEVTVGLLARHKHRHRQTPEQLRWFTEYLRTGGATKVSWEDIR